MNESLLHCYGECCDVAGYRLGSLTKRVFNFKVVAVGKTAELHFASHCWY